MTPIGVLVMAYGTPERLEDVEAFYTDVRRGRPPSAEQLHALVRRYEAIGGLSPLNAHTKAQVSALQAALDAIERDRYLVAYGTKHATPKIEDAVDFLAQAGASFLVGLVLAPHYSRLSVGQYLERALARALERRLGSAFLEHWHDEPALIDALARRVRQAVDALATKHRGPIEVVFSAHSLPKRILELDDPYPAQLASTASLVAQEAGLARYRLAWQSAGRTEEPWMGPDILEVIDLLASEGVPAIVVCPAGFTADHLEVLYDLDIEARERAERQGVAFSRTASLNDDPQVMAALARRVAAAASRLEP
jgi:ferrochelatase